MDLKRDCLEGVKRRPSLLRGGIAALIATALMLPAATGVLASRDASGRSDAVSAAGSGANAGALVVDWNKELLKIIATPGTQPATIHATRSLAMMHAAIYDAVISIDHGSSPYLFSLAASAGARPDAAAAQAAHDTLAALYPSLSASLDQELTPELAAIPEGTGKQEGIEVGHLAAALVLAARTNDGSNVTPPPLPAGTQPGAYRPPPPTNAPAAFTQWANVTPFVLQSASQFRPGPPPALSSPAYAAAINEVKSLGQDTSTTRSADETVVARFWSGPPWISWNEIADNAAISHHTNLLSTARLFAFLNLSLADTTIAFYEAKYHYLLWRPITAVRQAAGNPAVTADPTWNPLIATANDPSYPGAHSALSAAAATILTKFFGPRDGLKVTSDVLPGVIRTFSSYNAAASETGLSRIYAGVHTRFDHVAGAKLGREVAAYVLKQAGSETFGLRK